MIFLSLILYLTNLSFTSAYEDKFINVHNIDVTTRGDLPSDDDMKLCQTCFWPYQKNFTLYHRDYSQSRVKGLEMLKGAKEHNSHPKEVIDVKAWYKWHGTTWTSRPLRCNPGYHCAIKLHWDPIKGWSDVLNHIKPTKSHDRCQRGWMIINRKAKRPFIAYQLKTDEYIEVQFNPVTWYQKGSLKSVGSTSFLKSKVLMDLTYEANMTLSNPFLGDKGYTIPDGIFDVRKVKKSTLNSNKQSK